jgi:hypothetical protein
LSTEISNSRLANFSFNIRTGQAKYPGRSLLTSETPGDFPNPIHHVFIVRFKMVRYGVLGARPERVERKVERFRVRVPVGIKNILTELKKKKQPGSKRY